MVMRIIADNTLRIIARMRTFVLAEVPEVPALTRIWLARTNRLMCTKRTTDHRAVRVRAILMVGPRKRK